MSEITILVLEDETEVRAAIIRDLEPFSFTFRVEASDEVEDARAVIAEVQEGGGEVGLILCDHLLPGMRATVVESKHVPP